MKKISFLTTYRRSSCFSIVLVIIMKGYVCQSGVILLILLYTVNGLLFVEPPERAQYS